MMGLGQISVEDAPRAFVPGYLEPVSACPDHGAIVGALGLAWIRQEPIARLIVDHALAIIWANGQAERMLRGGRPILAHAGILRVAECGDTRPLAELLGLGQAGVANVAMVETGGQQLMIRATPIDGGAADRFYGISLLPASQHLKLPISHGAVFRLTGREAMVVNELLRGVSADGIAVERAISVQTVRTHIRNIYTKMNVTTREQMFAKVLPLCSL